MGTLSDFRGKLSLLGESHHFFIQRGIAAVIQEKHHQAILRDKRIMSQNNEKDTLTRMMIILRITECNAAKEMKGLKLDIIR